MKIIIENLSKRFNREWIFKNLSLELNINEAHAVTGPNGSGKSTLLKIIMGAIPSTDGRVIYKSSSKEIEEDSFYQHCSLSSPYLDLIEEYNPQELLDFHFKFKRLKAGFNKKQVLEIAYLSDQATKPIKYFSSGMKQRLKLALAFYSDTPLLLLDEPTSNLDAKGIEWYHQQIKNCKNRIIIVASNQMQEYSFCDQQIHIPDYVG